MAKRKVKRAASNDTLTLDKFWTWLQDHAHCILRVGTPDAVVFDDDDFHWRLDIEQDQTHVVQCLRGKRLIGEVVFAPVDVAYVDVVDAPGEEHLFELIQEGPEDRIALAHLVLTHGLEDDDEDPPDRWTH